ncbi:MAG: hypothetical protein IIC58_07930 [Proteobacteria bacterium]|nr:hypothetical protein [Pseudomonadota bacterium]
MADHSGYQTINLSVTYTNIGEDVIRTQLIDSCAFTCVPRLDLDFIASQFDSTELN